jgi:hypothetical protein
MSASMRLKTATMRLTNGTKREPDRTVVHPGRQSRDAPPSARSSEDTIGGEHRLLRRQLFDGTAPFRRMVPRKELASPER